MSTLRAVATGVCIALASAVAEETELIGLESECEYLVPGEGNGGSALATADWSGIAPPPNADQWRFAMLGIGYAGNDDIEYLQLMNWDILAEMRGVNASLFVRVPFELDAAELAPLRQMVLQMRFDDGFIVYLNGVEVERFNAPDAAVWDSTSTVSYADFGAARHVYDITEGLGVLVPGRNVLAVHLLNNTSTSQDAFVLPELWVSDTAAGSIAHPRHLNIVGIGKRADGLPVSITVGTAIGRRYQLQNSSNLKRWGDFDLPRISREADQQQLTFELHINRFTPLYWRVVELGG